MTLVFLTYWSRPGSGKCSQARSMEPEWIDGMRDISSESIFGWQILKVLPRLRSDLADAVALGCGWTPSTSRASAGRRKISALVKTRLFVILFSWCSFELALGRFPTRIELLTGDGVPRNCR